MENAEAKIYSEVDALINLMGNKYRDMLPQKVQDSINNKKDKSYNPVYSIDIPLEKQQVEKDSLAILANIQYNYWCITEEEKKAFMDELKQIDADIEQEKREKYNPNNIFKNKILEEPKENIEEVSMVVYDEKWYTKIAKFFSRLFKRNK